MKTNTTTTKPNACVALRVPATKAGRSFVARLRDYANYDAIERIRVRYSGPRPKGQRDTAAKDAHTLRVYLDRRDTRAVWRRVYSSLDEAARLRAENTAMYTDLSDTIRAHANTKHELVSALGTLAASESVNKMLGEHITAHAANVSRLEARVAQCPRWIWWLIDRVLEVKR